MTTHTVAVEIQSYNRLKDLRQQFWIFGSAYLKDVSTVEVDDVIYFIVKNQVDLVRKVTYTEEVANGAVASLVEHRVAKVAQAFAPKGGYVGSFH